MQGVTTTIERILTVLPVGKPPTFHVVTNDGKLSIDQCTGIYGISMSLCGDNLFRCIAIIQRPRTEATVSGKPSMRIARMVSLVKCLLGHFPGCRGKCHRRDELIDILDFRNGACSATMGFRCVNMTETSVTFNHGRMGVDRCTLH